MDPGGKGAPLPEGRRRNVCSRSPAMCFYIHSFETATAVSCKAGGGGASGMLSFPKPVPPLAHGAARSGEHRGRKTQKKELDFLHCLWYYTGAVARPQQIMREWWNWQTR